MRLLVFLVLITTVFSGCGAIKNAIDEKRTGKAKAQFDKHPDTAAHYCAVRFPLKDSLAPLVYINSDNPDYTRLIDSILHAVDSIGKDSLNASWALAVDSATTSLAGWFQKQLAASQKENQGLKNMIQRLRDQYRPCSPDTVKQIIFRIDGAAAADARAAAQREKDSRLRTEALNTSLKAKLNWWKIACLITWVLVGMIAGLKIGTLIAQSKIPIKIN